MFLSFKKFKFFILSSLLMALALMGVLSLALGTTASLAAESPTTTMDGTLQSTGTGSLMILTKGKTVTIQVTSNTTITRLNQSVALKDLILGDEIEAVVEGQATLTAISISAAPAGMRGDKDDGQKNNNDDGEKGNNDDGQKNNNDDGEKGG